MYFSLKRSLKNYETLPDARNHANSFYSINQSFLFNKFLRGKYHNKIYTIKNHRIFFEYIFNGA